jgi:cytochrome subunit of sulfide dehydrogenase
MRLRWPVSKVASIALAFAATGASAQDAQRLQTQSLAASCAQCHGTNGHAPPGSAMASIAGLQAAYLVEQMKAFKSGERPGTVMPQLAKGYDDAQIVRLAAYFAQQQQPAAAVKP